MSYTADNSDRTFNNEYDQKDYEEACDALETLFNLVNRGGHPVIEDAVTDAIKIQHRTLQQSFFRSIVMPSVNTFAELNESKFTDLRNESACECAAALKPIMDGHYMPLV